MDQGLETCPECATVFAPVHGGSLCEECTLETEVTLALILSAVDRGGVDTPRKIAAATGLGVAKIKKALRRSFLLAHAVDTRDTCVKCAARPAQRGSDYCLVCRLELFSSLGKAAGELEGKVEAQRRKPEAELGGMSVRDALARKRRRTGSYRFDPSPKRSKR